MPEITQEHLDTLALRLLTAAQRDTDSVRADIRRVEDRIVLQNGRVRRNEIGIAVLRWAVTLTGVTAMVLLTEFLRRVF